MLDGEDPTAYVLSANIHRRHMTKGQRAMAVVQALEGKKYTEYTHGISKQYISRAKITLEHAPDLAR